MTAELVSVVIPCYNASPFIEDTLDSALKQREAGVVDVEVIVVDDGPTDESPAKVEAASLANPGAIRLLRQPRNLGPAAARNVGLRHARAGLSAFLTLTINTPRVFLFGRSSISVSDRNSRRSLPTSNW